MDWDWPDELDALVAAPAHHLLLLENERVRVLETRIPAGETTAVHTHRWPSVQYVADSPDFIRERCSSTRAPPADGPKAR
jgi:hypothetical protein